MSIALIIAGGSGNRMGQDIPKQFLVIYEKPVIIYTLEAFERHSKIDAIYVVCIDGWQDRLHEYCSMFNISKLRGVVSNGNSAQHSICNGVTSLKEICSDNDIVVIHDGVRPLLDDEVLTDVIEKCKMYGNGVSSLPYKEQIFRKLDDVGTVEFIPREKLMRVSTPQAYSFAALNSAYTRATKENIGMGLTDYTNTMMVQLGVKLYFSKGSEKNLKLTTPDDLEIFKALLANDIRNV